MISEKGTGTSKLWHMGSPDHRRLRWVLGIAGFVLLLAVTIAISVGGNGSSKKLAADVTKIHRHSLTGDIQAFLQASSVLQMQCTRPSGGERSCQVEFENQYGTWWATIIVGRHHAISNPGGNANWLCASTCQALPKTTGLPRNNGAGSGRTIDATNSGVVLGTGNGGLTGTGNSPGFYMPGSSGAGNTGVGGGGYTGAPAGAGNVGNSPGYYMNSGNTGAGNTSAAGGGYTGATGAGSPGSVGNSPGYYMRNTGTSYPGATGGGNTGATGAG